MDDFSKWSRKTLIDFLETVKYNRPKQLKELLDCYDEGMRGN